MFSQRANKTKINHQSSHACSYPLADISISSIEISQVRATHLPLMSPCWVDLMNIYTCPHSSQIGSICTLYVVHRCAYEADQKKNKEKELLYFLYIPNIKIKRPSWHMVINWTDQGLVNIRVETSLSSPQTWCNIWLVRVILGDWGKSIQTRWQSCVGFSCPS